MRERKIQLTEGVSEKVNESEVLFRRMRTSETER